MMSADKVKKMVKNLVKKFGSLEKRVIFLERKSSGQQDMIKKLQKKLRKIRKSTKIQDQLIIDQVEDALDLKPDVNSIQISKSNELENPIENFDEIASNLKRSVKKSHVCSFCSKSFQSFERLSEHMRIHTRERPFKCEICSKTFKLMEYLKRHHRVHTGERPYSCSFCSNSFTQVNSLNDHIRSHIGERPYSCSVCSKTFTHSGNLIRHKKSIHTGEKPYSCSLCRLKFSRPDHLKRHEKCIHGQNMSTL